MEAMEKYRKEFSASVPIKSEWLKPISIKTPEESYNKFRAAVDAATMRMMSFSAGPSYVMGVVPEEDFPTDDREGFRKGPPEMRGLPEEEVITPVRYVLHPDYIDSKTDGQRHFIDARGLRQLYRVPLGAQVAVSQGNVVEEMPGDVHCYPREDGNYPVFEKGE
jgi:hypothetical protein